MSTSQCNAPQIIRMNPYPLYLSSACLTMSSKMGDDYISDLFDIASESIPIIRDIHSKNYCSRAIYMKREIAYMLIGSILIICSQVFFFAIVIDNHRTGEQDMIRLQPTLLDKKNRFKRGICCDEKEEKVASLATSSSSPSLSGRASMVTSTSVSSLSSRAR